MESKLVGTPFASTGKVQVQGNMWISDQGFVAIEDFGLAITSNVARWPSRLDS